MPGLLPSRVVLLLLAALGALAAVPNPAPAATAGGLTREPATSAERALALRAVHRSALAREQLDVQPPHSTLRVRHITAPIDVLEVGIMRGGSQHGYFIVEPASGKLHTPQPLAFMVLPRAAPLRDGAEVPWHVWLPLLAAFVLVLAPRGLRRGWPVGSGVLLAMSGAATVLLHPQLVAGHVRAGNVAYFTLTALVLVAGAAAWLRRAARAGEEMERPPPLLPWWVLAMLAVGGLLLQGLLLDPARVVDAGHAGPVGALLMRDGASVYGNIIPVPGYLSNADTYGPLLYLAYVPAAIAFDDASWAGLATNCWAALGIAALVTTVGWRRGGRTGASQAAAAWLTCPFALFGTIHGYNDVLVALPVGLAGALALRPAWRGGLVAAAGAMKFLPAVALAALLRVGSQEGWRAAGRAIATFVAVLAIAAVLGIHGPHALQRFWDATVRFQAHRPDLSSAGGILGIGGAVRVLVWVLLAATTAWCVLRPARTATAACLQVAALLAIAPLVLQQWSVTYVVWIVPVLIIAQPACATPPGQEVARVEESETSR